MAKTKLKGFVISVVSIGIFVGVVFSFKDFIINRKEQQKKEYIDNCVQKLKKLSFRDEDKHEACSCRHDYLYSKYGEAIYDASFMIPSKEDSVAVINCLLEATENQTIGSDTIMIELKK